MYIEKEVARGYTEYICCDSNNGEGSMMDVGFLLLEPGDSFSFAEEKKEVAWILLSGKMTLEYRNGTVEIDRPDPFDHSTWCLHLPAGEACTLKAASRCEIYVQKTYNDAKFEPKLYSADDTDTWHRGADGELCGCIKRDVRTSFDYENAPYSNMVLGETVNLPGRWSSYPPHSHPQPEVYFYYFDNPKGFGAGWANGEVNEVHHRGLLVITEGTHAQVMAPGYPCCIVWGIRHLPGNPWKKTRIDDPVHEWLVDPNAKFWGSEDR